MINAVNCALRWAAKMVRCTAWMPRADVSCGGRTSEITFSSLCPWHDLCRSRLDKAFSELGDRCRNRRSSLATRHSSHCLRLTCHSWPDAVYRCGRCFWSRRRRRRGAWSHHRKPVAIRRSAQCRYLFTCSHHVLVVCGGIRREYVCIRKIRLISLDTKDKRLSIVSRLNPSASSVKSISTQVETTKAS